MNSDGSPGAAGAGSGARKPRFLDEVRAALRARHYSRRTETAYVGWVRRYILHHGRRHPRELSAEAVNAFLTHLAVERGVSASTQNQALAALLFLYSQVLGRPFGELDGVVRAREPRRLPAVLTRGEVKQLLAELTGPDQLVATLLYGAGLRLLECLRLRVMDIDFARREIVVREGKGQKDRVTMLPAAAVEPLRDHLARVRQQHVADLERGLGRAPLPDALVRKYPNADREWAWQWVFPATTHFVDRTTGTRHRHTAT